MRLFKTVFVSTVTVGLLVLTGCASGSSGLSSASPDGGSGLGSVITEEQLKEVVPVLHQQEYDSWGGDYDIARETIRYDAKRANSPKFVEDDGDPDNMGIKFWDAAYIMAGNPDVLGASGNTQNKYRILMKEEVSVEEAEYVLLRALDSVNQNMPRQDEVCLAFIDEPMGDPNSLTVEAAESLGLLVNSDYACLPGSLIPSKISE